MRTYLRRTIFQWFMTDRSFIAVGMALGKSMEENIVPNASLSGSPLKSKRPCALSASAAARSISGGSESSGRPSGSTLSVLRVTFAGFVLVDAGVPGVNRPGLHRHLKVE